MSRKMFVSEPSYELPARSVSCPGGEEREANIVQVKMKFGDTEIKATAVDQTSGNAVSASVDFFTDKNPKYCTKL